MIQVSVFYPNTPGVQFDHTYYLEKHAPMVVEKLAPLGLVRGEVHKGLAGGTPDAPAPYVAVGHLVFHSIEAFQQAFQVHGAEIMGDIPNYSNVEPLIQISEIALSWPP